MNRQGLILNNCNLLVFFFALIDEGLPFLMIIFWCRSIMGIRAHQQNSFSSSCSDLLHEPPLFFWHIFIVGIVQDTVILEFSNRQSLERQR